MVVGLAVIAKNSLSLHSALMWPCSLHLKHVGLFLVSEEFGKLLLCRPLQPVGLVDILCGAVLVAIFAPLLHLHGSLRPVMPVTLVVNWSVGADPAPCIIESFMGGSYWSSPSGVVE